MQHSYGKFTTHYKTDTLSTGLVQVEVMKLVYTMCNMKINLSMKFLICDIADEV
jgi:hypothetical protein